MCLLLWTSSAAWAQHTAVVPAVPEWAPTEVHALAAALKPYGVRLQLEVQAYEQPVGEIATWQPMNRFSGERLAQYADLLHEEWTKYPIGWVKATGLRTIALVSGLRVMGEGRAAMPDLAGRALYLDISYLDAPETYVRSVIHHEFYHLVEGVHFGSMFYPDKAWAALNPAGFRYKGGGAMAYRDKHYFHTEHPRTGFVTAYAQYALEEDKAEVYAYLMTTARYRRLEVWLATDDILKRKVAYLLAFFERVDPSFTAAYLARLHAKP